MPLGIGSITVTAVDDITGSGLAKSLFDARKPTVDARLDEADAAAAGQRRQVDPAKVQTLLAADLAVNGPLVAGYAADYRNALAGDPEADAADYWPTDLLADLPGPIDRLPVYQGLAQECVDLATGIVPYFVDNTVIGPGTFAAGGDPVTGEGEIS